MADFVQDTGRRAKRQRKSSEAEPSDERRDEPSAEDRARNAELAARAAQLRDVPRAKWPADVLEYQRGADRARKAASRAALDEAADRMHREMDEAIRQEQRGDDDDGDDGNDQPQRKRERCCVV